MYIFIAANQMVPQDTQFVEYCDHLFNNILLCWETAHINLAADFLWLLLKPILVFYYSQY